MTAYLLSTGRTRRLQSSSFAMPCLSRTSKSFSSTSTRSPSKTRPLLTALNRKRQLVESRLKCAPTTGMPDVMTQLTSPKSTKRRRRSLQLPMQPTSRREGPRLHHPKDVEPPRLTRTRRILPHKQQRRPSARRLRKLQDSRKPKSRGRRPKRQQEQHTGRRLTLKKTRRVGKRRLRSCSPSSQELRCVSHARDLRKLQRHRMRLLKN